MRARALRSVVAALGIAAAGCGQPSAPPPTIVLALVNASTDAPARDVSDAALGAHAVGLGDGRFRVELADVPRSLEPDGYCPVTLPAGQPGRAHSGDLRIELDPLIDVGEVAPVGHDAPFEIAVRAGCRDALAGSIAWEIVGPTGPGAHDPQLAPERRGFAVRGRTASWSVPALPRWGIVPVSARASGEIVLRMRWTRPGAQPIERDVRVLAAARATGLPSVSLGAGVPLRGGPFSVREAPAGGSARPRALLEGIEWFVPDAEGRWVLADPSGRELALRVGTHEGTPLDCGRSECHARETTHAATSPMTGAFLSRVADPCALACHATGEPGLPDGGFAHVARRWGWSAPSVAPAEPLTSLPRPLRRLAGVGCTACHGTGAIPEASARWAILRADVCATCHDAPPRYGHVQAWARSAMSRSDVDPAALAPGCASCHTTAGFLESIGTRAHTDVPLDAGPLGIACAACHAPHAEAHLDRALVRRLEVPPSLGSLPRGWDGATSTVCLRCHAPSADEAPRASSAALLLGRGGVAVLDGAPIEPGPLAPHAELACLRCHGAPAAGTSLEVERGASHEFAVDRARCVECHDAAEIEAASASETSLLERARLVARALGVVEVGHRGEATTDLATARGRAAHDVRLVLGDPGAWAHGPAYAGRLLDEAERATSDGPAPPADLSGP